MLLNINERKQWSNPPPNDPAARALQDEEIFQTARLVKYVISPILELSYSIPVNQLWTFHVNDFR